MRVFDYLIDAIFWIDILLNFTTSYYVGETLVTSRKEIVKHNFTSWVFYADFMATFPWEVLSSATGGNYIDPSLALGCDRGLAIGGVEDGNFRVLKLFRLLRCAPKHMHAIFIFCVCLSSRPLTHFSLSLSAFIAQPAQGDHKGEPA